MEKIDRVMAKFRKAMIDKFHKKEAGGWIGWDTQEGWTMLIESLREHAQKPVFDASNFVDIALLAMFLWNLETEGSELDEGV